MIPAALLICITLVTNSGDQTIASKTCELPSLPLAANSFEKLSFRSLNDVAEVAVLRVKDSNLLPLALKFQQSQIHRATLVVNIPHQVHVAKPRIIPAFDVSQPRKALSFWDKLKNEPATAFKPIVTD